MHRVSLALQEAATGDAGRCALEAGLFRGAVPLRPPRKWISLLLSLKSMMVRKFSSRLSAPAGLHFGGPKPDQRADARMRLTKPAGTGLQPRREDRRRSLLNSAK